MAGCPSETPIATTLDQRVAVFFVVEMMIAPWLKFIRTADDHYDHHDHNGGVAWILPFNLYTYATLTHLLWFSAQTRCLLGHAPNQQLKRDQSATRRHVLNNKTSKRLVPDNRSRMHLLDPAGMFGWGSWLVRRDQWDGTKRPKNTQQ